MCPLSPAWLFFIFGLLPLETESRTLPLPTGHSSSRLPKSSGLTVATDAGIAQGDRNIIWRALMHKESPPSLSDPLLHHIYDELGDGSASTRGSRGRRQASFGGGRGHGHMMRVGCVLGTCQVQNLSHRLYQLVGQSGREGSSPINPRSPHSYG